MSEVVISAYCLDGNCHLCRPDRDPCGCDCHKDYNEAPRENPARFNYLLSKIGQSKQATEYAVSELEDICDRVETAVGEWRTATSKLLYLLHEAAR